MHALYCISYIKPSISISSFFLPFLLNTASVYYYASIISRLSILDFILNNYESPSSLYKSIYTTNYNNKINAD